MTELLCARGNLVDFVGTLITSLVTRADWVAVDIIAIGRRTGGALGMSLLMVLLLLSVRSPISALWGILSLVVAALLILLGRLLVISPVALVVRRLRVVLALSRIRVAIASLMVVLLLAIPLRRGRLVVSPTGAVALPRVSVRHWW